MLYQYMNRRNISLKYGLFDLGKAVSINPYNFPPNWHNPDLGHRLHALLEFDPGNATTKEINLYLASISYLGEACDRCNGPIKRWTH